MSGKRPREQRSRAGKDSIKLEAKTGNETNPKKGIIESKSPVERTSSPSKNKHRIGITSNKTPSKKRRRKDANCEVLPRCSRCLRLALKCSGETPCTHCVEKGYNHDCVYEPFLRCHFCILAGTTCSEEYPCNRCSSKGIQCFYTTACTSLQGKKVKVEENVKISLLRTCMVCRSKKIKCSGGYPCKYCYENRTKCVIELESPLRGNAKACDYCKKTKVKCLGGYPCFFCSKRRTGNCVINGNDALETTFATYNAKMQEDISSPMQNPNLEKWTKRGNHKKQVKATCYCALCTSKPGPTQPNPNKELQGKSKSNSETSNSLSNGTGTAQSSIKNPVIAFLQSEYVQISEDPQDFNPRNSLVYCSVQLFQKALKWYTENFYEGEIPKGFYLHRNITNACSQVFKEAGVSITTIPHTKMWFGIEVNTRYLFGIRVDLRKLIPSATTTLEAAKEIAEHSNSKPSLDEELLWPRKTNTYTEYGSVSVTSAMVSAVINSTIHKNTKYFSRLVPLEIENGKMTWTNPEDSIETERIMKLLTDKRSVRLLPLVGKKIEDHEIIRENEVQASPLSKAELNSCVDWIRKRKHQTRNSNQVVEKSRNPYPASLRCKWWYTLDTFGQRIMGEWAVSGTVSYLSSWKQYRHFAEMKKLRDYNDEHVQKGLKYSLSALVASESVVLIRAVVSRMFFLCSRLSSSAFVADIPYKTKYSGMLICMLAIVRVLPRFGYSLTVLEEAIFSILNSWSKIHQRDMIELKPFFQFLDAPSVSKSVNGENLLCCTDKLWGLEILEQRVHYVTGLHFRNKSKINRKELNTIIEDINRLIVCFTKPTLNTLVTQLRLRFC